MKPSELLADPKAWTKGASARSASGRRVAMDSKRATAFCTVGAIHRCYESVSEYSSALGKMHDHVGGFISSWNDKPERTHAEVLEALKACGL